jgi:hypothetical protein
MIRTSLLCAALGIALAPVPGHADTVPVSARARVWVQSWDTVTAKICAQGNVDNGQPPWVSEWTFSVVAIGSDRSTTVPSPILGSTWFFSDCLTFPIPDRSGYLSAQLTLGTVGLPDLTLIDVTALAGVVAAWDSTVFTVGYSTSG